MPFQQVSPITEISIDGFQVVSGSMFSRVPRNAGPTCTLWVNHISFGKHSVEALNNCERIRIQVNPTNRCLLIVPVTATDPDGVRWIKNKNRLVEPRKLDCVQFTTQLFDTWGWDKEYFYRTSGQLVSSEKKVMLLFNFSNPESWKTKEQRT